MRVVPLLLTALLLILTACTTDAPRGPRSTDDTAPTTDINAIDTHAARQLTRNGNRSRNRVIANSRAATSASGADANGLPLPDVRVTGSITLPGGAPAPGANVKLWTAHDDTLTSIVWNLRESTTTTADGTYALKTARQHYWAITATKPGYALASKQEQRTRTSRFAPDITNYLNLQLQPATRITGIVRSPNGHPIPNANVLAAPATQASAAVAELSTFTALNGQFTIDALPAGGVTLVVNAPGYRLETFHVAAPDHNLVLTLSENQPRLDGRLISPDLPLAGTSITLILDADAGIQMPGLYMRWQQTPAADGTFNFGPIPPTDQLKLFINSTPTTLYPVPASHNEHLRPYATIPFDDNQSTTAEIRVTPGATLHGKTIDHNTSKPLAGIRVYHNAAALKAGQPYTETNRNGDFSITGIYDPRQVHVRSDRYHMNPNATEIRITSEPLIIRMYPSTFIRGTVTAAVGGPVANATLTIARYDEDPGHGSPIDIAPDGSFHVAVDPDEYYLIAQAPRYAIAAVPPFKVGDEDINDIDIKLSSGHHLTGIVTDTTSAPVHGAIVNANLYAGQDVAYGPTWGNYTLGPPICNTVTGPDGTFQLTGLPAQIPLVITATSSAHAAPAAQELIIDSNPDPIHLVLQPSARLHGTIIDEESNPVSGASIHISAGHRDSVRFTAHTASTSTGSFTLHHVPETTLSLQITKTDYNDHSQDAYPDDKPVSVTLMKPKFVDIQVRCLDHITRQPVLDAQFDLLMRENTGYSIDSVEDQPGLYIIKNIDHTKSFHIIIAAPGYNRQADTIDPAADDTIHEILLRPSTTFYGRVIDSQTRQPVPGAKIIDVRNESEILTTTDPKGEFRFSSNTSRIHVKAVASDDRQSAAVVPAIATGEIDLGDIEIYGNIPVTIKVINAHDRKAIPNVKIEYQADSPKEKQTGTTDSDGIYKTQVHPDSAITITLPDYQLSRSESPNPSAREQIITIPVGSAALQGRILYNGKPQPGSVSGHRINMASSRAFTRTDDGTFEFTNLSPGTWEFHAGSDHGSGKITVEIPNNATTIKRDIPVGQHIITGIVIDHEHNPVASARVRARSEAGYLNETLSDSAGKFRMDFVRIESHDIVAEKTTVGHSDIHHVTVSESGTVEPITLILKPGIATITCTILSILDGFPIENSGAALNQSESALTPRGRKDQATGNVIIENVREGTYTLTVSAPGYTRATRTITVNPGDNLHFTDVLSPAAQINIRLTHSNGQTVPGIPVTLTPLDSQTLETPRTVTTDPKGYAAFNGVLYGTYTATATLPTGETPTATISTHNRASINLTLTP